MNGNSYGNNDKTCDPAAKNSASDEQLLEAFFAGHMSAYVSVMTMMGRDETEAIKEGNFFTAKMAEDPAVRMEILDMLKSEERSRAPRTLSIFLD